MCWIVRLTRFDSAMRNQLSMDHKARYQDGKRGVEDEIYQWQWFAVVGTFKVKARREIDPCSGAC